MVSSDLPHLLSSSTTALHWNLSSSLPFVVPTAVSIESEGPFPFAVFSLFRVSIFFLSSSVGQKRRLESDVEDVDSKTTCDKKSKCSDDSAEVNESSSTDTVTANETDTRLTTNRLDLTDPVFSTDRRPLVSHFSHLHSLLFCFLFSIWVLIFYFCPQRWKDVSAMDAGNLQIIYFLLNTSLSLFSMNVNAEITPEPISITCTGRRNCWAKFCFILTISINSWHSFQLQENC